MGGILKSSDIKCEGKGPWDIAPWVQSQCRMKPSLNMHARVHMGDSSRRGPLLRK